MSISDIISLIPAIVDLSNGVDWQHHAISSLFLAQFIENVDILGNIQNAWQEFLHTGRAAALVVGLVLGYIIRGVTR
jgi:hypothetical protein